MFENFTFEILKIRWILSYKNTCISWKKFTYSNIFKVNLKLDNEININFTFIYSIPLYLLKQYYSLVYV